ncbi:TetR/AcrR family transcriptional regulator [candidate division KSB1 bacterium]|nr:TetR/AcrR family transcriptional regulator [candidate division KSB1 bacterium]RQW02863.1 MAG: TetR/AcrR family transcriptional regulator [candidate division KSB1 bacterium]
MSYQSPEKHTHTKEIIFRTAAHLFAQKGFDGVSMREISEQSGVTKPTIYYYFGSKEGIYEALIDSGLQHVISSFEEIAHIKVSAKDKLVMMTKKFFQLTVDAPDFSKFFMTLAIPLSDNTVLEKFRKQMFNQGNILKTVINEGIKSGEFGAAARPDLAAQIIGGVWQHYAWQQLSTKKKILSEELAEEIIEILFRGLNE